MMVKFSTILNPLILDAGIVGFNGDSEYLHPERGVMMGSWIFHEILEDAPSDNDWNLDDEIPDEVLYNQHLFKIINNKGAVCVVQFLYFGRFERFAGEENGKEN